MIERRTYWPGHGFTAVREWTRWWEISSPYGFERGIGWAFGSPLSSGESRGTRETERLWVQPPSPNNLAPDGIDDPYVSLSRARALSLSLSLSLSLCLFPSLSLSLSLLRRITQGIYSSICRHLAKYRLGGWSFLPSFFLSFLPSFLSFPSPSRTPERKVPVPPTAWHDRWDISEINFASLSFSISSLERICLLCAYDDMI